jgi:uncharacterized phage protein gp47/JayE
MTSVPKITLGPTGFIAPAEADILAGAQTDISAAFGGGLNMSAKTPQGQLAVTWAAATGDKNDEVLATVNGFDPALSSGRMQDAIGRIYFIERIPAAPTVVVATCTGRADVVIPVGALAKASDGNLYACVSAVTIPGGGSVQATFQCARTGPIACPAGSLTTITQAIDGWDTITNAADGTLGNNVETAAAFEARRQQSVAINANGIVPAIQGKVLAVANVLDAYTVENPVGSPQVIGGVTVGANSIFVSVTGGSDADVAAAIWSKKAPGCAYTGTTTVTVEDSNSGYVDPLPSYTVKFTRTTELPIKIAVSVKNSASVPSDYIAQVQAALINAFAGGDGGPRARIGALLLALRYFSPIAALGAWAQVVSIQIGTVTANANEVQVNIDQQPSLSTSDISVSLV